jgi:hypothetical protein
LQRTGISVLLIENLPLNVVVARPLKRGVMRFLGLLMGTIIPRQFLWSDNHNQTRQKFESDHS